MNQPARPVDPKLQRPQRVAVLAGDGIGRDVTVEAVKVLEAAAERWSLPLELVHFPYSADHYLETGVSLPSRGRWRSSATASRRS